MHARRTLTRIATKAGFLSCLLLIAALTLSIVFEAGSVHTSALGNHEITLSVCNGGVYYTRRPKVVWIHPPPRRWSVAVAARWTIAWRAKWEAGPQITDIRVPLWMPLVPCALVNAILWRADRINAKATRACRRCGYPRSGLAPGATCPECGQPAGGLQ